MQLLTEELIKDLLARQRQFFSRGATLSYDFRRASLLKLKAAILNHQTELEEALYKDLGKNRQESYTSEIGFVLAEITHTLKHLRRWMRPVRAKSTMSLFLSSSKAEKVPYGSVLIIGPFNYPFQLLVEPLVAAVAAERGKDLSLLLRSEILPIDRDAAGGFDFHGGGLNIVKVPSAVQLDLPPHQAVDGLILRFFGRVCRKLHGSGCPLN